MLCSDIMDKAPLTLTPDTAVTDALAQLKDAGLAAAAVIDGDGVAVGVFSLRHLLENTLPVSMSSPSAFGHMTVSAAPGLERRLQKTLQQDVSAMMARRFCAVHPDTPVAQAAQLVVEKGMDVIVLDEETGRLMGVVSEHIVIDGLLSASTAAAKKVVGQ